MKLTRTFLTLSAVAAIAAPTAATATAGKSGDPKPASTEAKKKGHSKAKMNVFRGTFVSGDAAAGTVVVAVDKASGRAKRFNGTQVTFSIAGLKKLHVADTNADGKRDLADVKAGDRVKVLAKLAKDAEQPFKAKKFQAKAPEAPEAAPAS